jgi:hypothetical protein
VSNPEGMDEAEPEWYPEFQAVEEHAFGSFKAVGMRPTWGDVHGYVEHKNPVLWGKFVRAMSTPEEMCLFQILSGLHWFGRQSSAA